MSCSSEENVLKQGKAIVCVFLKECEMLGEKKEKEDKNTVYVCGNNKYIPILLCTTKWASSSSYVTS